MLTAFTGSAYFPGGVGEFEAPQNEFLVFENGPSIDVVLQWATYRDASDQSSLSRIWGGIHPPADDINGRKIGIEVGNDAFDLAELYFTGQAEVVTGVESPLARYVKVYPNPVAAGQQLVVQADQSIAVEQVTLYNASGVAVAQQLPVSQSVNGLIALQLNGLEPGLYFIQLAHRTGTITKPVLVQ